MNISAKIIADSIAPSGIRMTTMEIEYPRFILAEVNTHRMLSKNSASSRAIPIAFMHQSLRDNGAEPIYWGRNKQGMQADSEISEESIALSKIYWDCAKELAITFSNKLYNLGLHKQIVNRITEPWMTMKTVISGTEWNNFYHLRNHKDAQPEFAALARAMYKAHITSTPMELESGEWHVPYVNTYRRDDNQKLIYVDENGEELTAEEARIISASCCAQVSYRKNDPGIDKARAIFNQLINSTPAHASPVEHQATPMSSTNWEVDPEYWELGVTHVTTNADLWSGNLRGWVQHRKLLDNEAVWGEIPYNQI